MGWRPSDRDGVVLIALQRAERPLAPAGVASQIAEDAELRGWWSDVPTPGQSYRPILLSTQNVLNRLIQLERRWAVIGEDGRHPHGGWHQRHFRLVHKDEREALRLRMQAELRVPPALEREALAAASALGLRADFFIRGSDHGHYYAICRIESKRGEVEHQKWLTADLRAGPAHLDETWGNLLSDAGLIEW